MLQNRPAGRSLFRFSTRDLLWAMVLVGLGISWFVNREQWRQAYSESERERTSAELNLWVEKRHMADIENILKERFPERVDEDFDFEVGDAPSQRAEWLACKKPRRGFISKPRVAARAPWVSDKASDLCPEGVK